MVEAGCLNIILFGYNYKNMECRYDEKYLKNYFAKQSGPISVKKNYEFNIIVPITNTGVQA